MSLRKEKTAANQGMSKREQRKLEQTLKLFSAFEAKPKKRRKTNQKGINSEPAIKPRDSDTDLLPFPPEQSEKTPQTKQQSPSNLTPISQASNEPIKDTPTPPKDNQTTKEVPQASFLNKRYFQDANVPTWSEFWCDYQYKQMQIQFQKRNKTYDYLDSLGTPLTISKHGSSQLIHNISSARSAFLLSSDRRPFSKSHKAFSSVLAGLNK